MNNFSRQFKKALWSPYVAGALLGVVGVLAVWLSDSLLGASGAFESVAGLVGKALAPQAFNVMYFNFIMPPGITWGVVLLIGTIIGGAIGALSSKTWKLRLNTDDPQWIAIFGPRLWKRSNVCEAVSYPIFWNTRPARLHRWWSFSVMPFQGTSIVVRRTRLR